MSDLFIVIPAAGRSQRFLKSGYRAPKPLLWVDPKEGAVARMVSHVVHSAPAGKAVIGLPRDTIIPKELRKISTTIENSIGQADTVWQLVRFLPDDARVLVLDCDMVLPSATLEKMVQYLEVMDVVLAVTETFDPNASRVDTIPFPTRFVEKIPISQWGIVGARAFKRADLLTSALEIALANCVDNHEEPYLSMAIQHYPGSKYAHMITEFQDWGTPERLKESGAQIVDEG